MKHEETTDTKALISRLRDEAQSFAPEMPPGLHGRVASAIAGAPEPAPARSWSIRWWMTATLAAAAIALGIFLLRDRTPSRPIVQAPPAPKWDNPPALPLTANPITLAQQWVERPFQDELDTLKNHLTSAGDTLTSSLPAAPKSIRPKAL